MSSASRVLRAPARPSAAEPKQKKRTKGKATNNRIEADVAEEEHSIITQVTVAGPGMK